MGSEIRVVLQVSSDISVELRVPESQIRVRSLGLGAPMVLMPEAAVNEDHLTKSRQHDVWLSR